MKNVNTVIMQLLHLWKSNLLGNKDPLAGDLSRNRTVGLRIGRGETLEDITKDMTAIAEGVLTARSAHMLAKKLNVQASYSRCS
jgi:hypothetical protein